MDADCVIFSRDMIAIIRIMTANMDASFLKKLK